MKTKSRINGVYNLITTTIVRKGNAKNTFFLTPTKAPERRFDNM